MFLENHVPGQWLLPWTGKVGEQGLMSVRAALTALVRNWKLSALLRDCIAFTGDVDTVATGALTAASCSLEHEQDLSASLMSVIENGTYGTGCLAAPDTRLV